MDYETVIKSKLSDFAATFCQSPAGKDGYFAPDEALSRDGYRRLIRRVDIPEKNTVEAYLRERAEGRAGFTLT